MFTFFVCFFLGGIVSEFVQSLLPASLSPFRSLLISLTRVLRLAQNLPVRRYRRAFFISHTLSFAMLIASEKANLLGSGIGLYLAYHLEKYYRRRREVRTHPFPLLGQRLTLSRFPRQIWRLYRPLSASNSSLALDSEEEDESGTQLLPLHNKPDTSPSALFPQNNTKKGKARARAASLALADVWDEREELFGVGEADEDDDEDRGQDGGEGEGEGEVRTTPAPLVRQERQNTPRPTKPPKSVRWAEGSA